MKKLILSLAVVLASVSFSNAQAIQAGNIQVTGGIGYSLIGSLFNATIDAATTTDPDVEGGGTPVINGMVDYAVGDRFTIGLAGSYQSFNIRYTDDYATSQGENSGNAYKTKWNCLNIGLRPLFHVGNSESLDLYVGARISKTIWSYSSGNSDDQSEDGGVSLPGIGVQPLFGGTYYFTDNIGLNMEIGIGTYLTAIGLNAKF